MKTSKKILTFAIITAGIFTISLSSCKKDNDNNTQKVYALNGNANGTQVVPSVTGTGSGTFSGTYDPNTMQLNYTTAYNGLTGMPSGGGLYYGASGATGIAVGNPFTYGTNTTGTGTYTGTMTLTADQANQLTTGNWYYGYNTTTNPAGEIRGQITATR